MKEKREHIRFYQQKRILHKYVRWLYELLADGRFYSLPSAKRIKGLPKEFTYLDIPMNRRCPETDGNWRRYEGSTKENPKETYVEFFEKIYHCHDTLHGWFNKETQELTVTNALRTCQTRFCPVCEVKKSIREYSKLRYNLDTFGDKYEYFMLTLTLPNNKEGFKEELDIYKKCLSVLFDNFGFYKNEDRGRICEGCYGSYEITVSEENGWHPHLHIILAYPKEHIKVYKDHTYQDGYKTVHFLDEFVATDGNHIIALNYEKIVKIWVDTVKKYTRKYDDLFSVNEWLSVNFVRIDNIDDGINELAKYLVDFTQIQNKDQLYIYMRDSYGTKQRLRRGVFIWSDEVEEGYKERINELRAERNKDFIQSREVVACSVEWDDYYNYHVVYCDNIQVDVPYTSLKKWIVKNIVYKLE